MEGSATFVIVASRITMNCARQTTTTVTSQWRCVVLGSVMRKMGERGQVLSVPDQVDRPVRMTVA
jgi:hypothetical protein